MDYGKSIYSMVNWNVLGRVIHRPASPDPQNVWLPLFTVQGTGVITGLLGRRTIAQAGGASTIQFRHSTIPSILDDGTLIITADPAATLYVCGGDPTDPVLSGLGIVPGAIAPFFFTNGGDIEVTMTAVAGTGSTEYWLFFIPISNGKALSA